jgi:hypothetical protein
MCYTVGRLGTCRCQLHGALLRDEENLTLGQPRAKVQLAPTEMRALGQHKEVMSIAQHSQFPVDRETQSKYYERILN